MRNSFNTAGFSEVVHEIRNDPAEAAFRYAAEAQSSPYRGLSAKIGPALFGTVKSARRFSVELRDVALPDGTDAPGADGPLPMHLALTGVASCALTTLVGGGSAQSVVFESADMDIAWDGGAVASRIDVGGVPDDETVAELVGQVERFSPNYTTLTRPVPVALRYGPDAAPAHAATAEGAPAAGRPAACRVRWISGTQLASMPLGQQPADELRVDAPKQLTGVDWGPNPQEYLLMGLAADVASHLGRTARELTGRATTWRVTVRGTEDVGGLLQADPSAVVQLQDMECAVPDPAGLSGAELEKVVAAAWAASEVRYLIEAAPAVRLTSHRVESCPA
ncbi:MULTISPECIES: OsmC family protein [Streptomyces]|uniref:OsmC family protein n=1 Tax=Streptomyces TaxID=1883 RepID=UPI00163BFAFE|nr:MULTISPECIES: OsmC family protein [Streptomyces]MBC2874303.1 OsmC family protein [Streptomyces sp. TYQ1024]UBI40338.1 OsmC family protein [Streptomyces mobaraensis]UKW32918.1 OsmC family protein [Streptomyces sp. TYQ1024]